MLDLNDRVIASNGYVGTITALHEDRILATVDFDWYPVQVVCISAELTKWVDDDVGA